MKNDFIEEWRDVKGYEGYYMISNLGNVYTIKRKYLKNKDLKLLTTSNGYLFFAPSVHCNQKTIMINRAVYEAFIGEIPENYDVHHKNHIRTDNMVYNLEIIPSIEHTKMHSEKRIRQYTKDGEFINEYKSLSEASNETGISISHISSVCHNRIKFAGGYIWKYC